MKGSSSVSPAASESSLQPATRAASSARGTPRRARAQSRGYAALSSTLAWCRDPHVLTLVFARRGLPQHRVVLRGVKFGGSDENDEEGAEALKREVKFKFERIFLNGFCPLTGESETGARAA